MSYKRVESLNDDPEFIEAIGDLVHNHLKDPNPSAQFKLRCPQCVNTKCGKTKAFFKEQAI